MSREKSEDYSGQAGRLREVRERLGQSQEDLARILGVSLDRLGRAERGENPVPSEILQALGEKFFVSATWILAGQGPMDWRQAAVPAPREGGLQEPAPTSDVTPWTATETEAEIIPADDYEALRREVRPEYVPLLASTAAGPPSLESDGDYPPGWAEEFVHAPGAPRECFALRIRGESMAPDYPDRSIVLVGAPVVPQEGEVLAVVFFGADADRRHQMKMVSRRGKAVRLRPLNPHYREEEVPIGRIVACLGVLCRLR